MAITDMSNDETIQSAKDANGAVYRRLNELQVKVNRLIAENDDLKTRNQNLASRITNPPDRFHEGYQAGKEFIKKLIADR